MVISKDGKSGKRGQIKSFNELKIVFSELGCPFDLSLDVESTKFVAL